MNSPAAPSIGNLPQAFELPDAVIHVNYIIARLQIGEIAEKTAGLWTRSRPLLRSEVSKRSALP